jgi:RsiW-degrading membrane proteinase PrsW (M82 family)
MIFLLLLTASAPGLFLLWYFYHRDRYEPEPKRIIIKVFFLGAVMVIPAAIIEMILIYVADTITRGFINIFILSFIIIAPTEELLKFFVVKRWVYRSIEFDEVMDGVVYTVSASLGFATVENIFYVVAQGMGTGIVRAFLAVPGHALFGALMGYYIGRAKLNKVKETQLIIRGIMLAIIVHGLYDFLLLTRTVFALLVIILLITLGIVVERHLKKASLESKLRLKAQQRNDTDTHQKLSKSMDG